MKQVATDRSEQHRGHPAETTGADDHERGIGGFVHQRLARITTDQLLDDRDLRIGGGPEALDRLGQLRLGSRPVVARGAERREVPRMHDHELAVADAGFLVRQPQGGVGLRRAVDTDHDPRTWWPRVHDSPPCSPQG